MDDTPEYSISVAAKSRLPIFLPWNREQKPITASFQSQGLVHSEGPWLEASPFTGDSRLSSICQVDLAHGTARDVEAFSASNTTIAEHFSGGLRISVGNAVARLSASSTYNHDVQSKQDRSRASHTSGFRIGRIVLSEDPALSATSRAILQSKDGVESFRKQFGDYFVAGYVLGADAGSCLLASSDSMMEVETVTTAVSVAVLWEEFTDTTSDTTLHQSYEQDLEFYGYDTLDGLNWSLRAETGKPTIPIRAAAVSCMRRANTLRQRLDERIRALGIKDRGLIRVGQCSKISGLALVSELILIPYGTLKEYVQCMHEGLSKSGIDSAFYS